MAEAKIDPRRRAELGKIHIAKKDLGLDDDAYRGAVRRVSRGRTDTAAKLRAEERAALLDHFKACGFRPARKASAAGPAPRQVLKARALYRALQLLGAVRGGRPSLDAFVKRQTGVDRLGWCTPAQLNQVIEGLRGWAARHGFDVPSGADPHEAKAALVRALWAKLHEAGAARLAGPSGHDSWVHDAFSVRNPPRAAGVAELDDARLDLAAEDLGDWLRKYRSTRR